MLAAYSDAASFRKTAAASLQLPVSAETMLVQVCNLGGNCRRCSASTVMTATSAPAAPSRWPCKALVELTRSPPIASPQTLRKASLSKQ